MAVSTPESGGNSAITCSEFTKLGDNIGYLKAGRNALYAASNHVLYQKELSSKTFADIDHTFFSANDSIGTNAVIQEHPGSGATVHYKPN